MLSVRQRYPNHRKCSVKLSPKPRTDLGSMSSPRTSRFPNSIIKQQLQITSASHPATAFNNTKSRACRQAFIDNSVAISSHRIRSANHHSTSTTIAKSPRLAPANHPLHNAPQQLAARGFPSATRISRRVSIVINVSVEIQARSPTKNRPTSTNTPTLPHLAETRTVARHRDETRLSHARSAQLSSRRTN